jgi:hypothetical protein
MLPVDSIDRAVLWELEEVLQTVEAEMALEGQRPLCPMATQAGQPASVWRMLLSGLAP